MATIQDDQQVPVVPDDSKSRLKESYDAIAPTYNDWNVEQTSVRIEYLEKILERLHTSTSSEQKLHVLELGCGCGVPVSERLLMVPGISVTANDMSSTQIKLAKENLAKYGTDRISFIEGDMMSLEFLDGSFDAIVGMYSLIHLPREEQSEMIRRIAKWLKPGGFLLVNFTSKNLPGLVMENWLHEKGWMYWSGWGAEGTLDKIKEAGLETIEKDEIKDDDDVTFLWVMAKK
ncbi:hypothetical protein EsH8_IX_000440 [Colletotrichum jinshuiense]